MQPFSYSKPGSVADAVARAAQFTEPATPPTRSRAQFIAGATNLADYMKLGVAEPQHLIDLNGLTDPGLWRIDVSDRGIRFGALVRMSEAADNDVVKRFYPVIAESLKYAASGQIRNMATLAGNILQRSRCEYLRDISWPCNRRQPGSGCAAMGGVNRQHAVLGTSDHCIATYHGDFAQALIALDASVEIEGPNGRRQLNFSRLHRLPGESPDVETDLASDEIIIGIDVPAGPWTPRSRYLKIRDRQSYAFALASAAVALQLSQDRVDESRIALGGVATVPWRARRAEEALRGRQLDEGAALAAAEAEFVDARPHGGNAFKVPLGKRTLVRALLEARDMRIST
jgi:xanthine dehydrogenase YagS FAD-binding subunit